MSLFVLEIKALTRRISARPMAAGRHCRGAAVLQRYWPRPRKDSGGRAGSCFQVLATVQHFSPQNTAKSDNSVFWFLAPWAKFGAS